MKKTITKEIEVSAIETRSLSKCYKITKTIDIDEKELEEDCCGDEDMYLEPEYREMEEEAESKLKEDWENEVIKSEEGSAELEEIEGNLVD